MTAHWINRVHYVHVALAFTTYVPDTRPHSGGELQIIISTVNHYTYWWMVDFGDGSGFKVGDRPFTVLSTLRDYGYQIQI